MVSYNHIVSNGRAAITELSLFKFTLLKILFSRAQNQNLPGFHSLNKSMSVFSYSESQWGPTFLQTGGWVNDEPWGWTIPLKASNHKTSCENTWILKPSIISNRLISGLITQALIQFKDLKIPTFAERVYTTPSHLNNSEQRAPGRRLSLCNSAQSCSWRPV